MTSTANPPHQITASRREQRPMPRRRRPIRPFRALQYCLLVTVVLVADLPLLWVVVNAIRPETENVAYPPQLLPQDLTLEHFEALFELHGFGSYLLNSLMVSTVATVGSVVLGTMAAYALSRFPFLFLRVLGRGALLAYLIPPILILVPITQILFGAGLGDNLWALTVLYIATPLLPFALWMLRSYFHGFTVSLEEAAMIDGCTRFGAFRRVVIPQAMPGIVTTAVFAFTAAWSEYLYASTLISSRDDMTANPALYLLMGNMGGGSWGLLMAAALTIVAPVVALYLVVQRWLVSGIGEGSVKG